MKLGIVISNAFDAMISSYEGKRFWPSLILKLLYALVSAVITVLFASTLFSRNSIANQIFAALFFYFLMVSFGKIIEEIKRGGICTRLRTTLRNMVRLKPPALWFFIAAAVISLVLPYAFVLSLALLLFCSALSGENSFLLGIKNAVTHGKAPERNGCGLAAFTSGLVACGLIVCILTNLGVPTPYKMIDGTGPKKNVTQTDPSGTVTDNADSTQPGTAVTDGYPDVTQPDHSDNTDNGSIIVSGDTDIKDAAGKLTDLLIKYAGYDRDEFEKLFRSTDSSVIDQYYNTSYDKFREYGNSLIAISVQDDLGDLVWFTALYYRIPDGYPNEKEQSVYLSTIMSRSDDGWKIEWNDDARSRLQSRYEDAGFSYYGLEARDTGYAWAKFFIPFDIYTEFLYYDDAVMCKVVEMYMDENGDLNLTLYASNGTDCDVGLNEIDISVSDGDMQLFSESFESNLMVQKDNVTIFALKILSEELDFTTWSAPKITDFRFSYENLDY